MGSAIQVAFRRHNEFVEIVDTFRDVGKRLIWSFLRLEGDHEEEVYRSPNGLIVPYPELRTVGGTGRYRNGSVYLHMCVLVGCASIADIPSDVDRDLLDGLPKPAELYKPCEVVIEEMDHAGFQVYAADPTRIDRIREQFEAPPEAWLLPPQYIPAELLDANSE